jgi:hypothetical protein
MHLQICNGKQPIPRSRFRILPAGVRRKRRVMPISEYAVRSPRNRTAFDQSRGASESWITKHWLQASSLEHLVGCLIVTTRKHSCGAPAVRDDPDPRGDPGHRLMGYLQPRLRARHQVTGR